MTTTSKRVETTEMFAFIIVRVQLPESNMETPSTLTPTCWLPVPTYLTSKGMVITNQDHQPHAPGAFSRASGHGHHQVHPVLPDCGVGRQVHQCLVWREEHRLTCVQRIQLESVHVKDNFKTSPLLKMTNMLNPQKDCSKISLHRPKLEGQFWL